MIRSLEPAIQKLPDHVKGTKNARRTKPFWIYIFGEPRIGKTSMLQPYLVNVIAKECGLVDSYRDYSEYTYFRNCGIQYWEKYNGQPVLWYNDLFQVFTDEQRVNTAIEELTNVVDDNLFPLDTAFEDKGTVFFDSQLVISNAQKDIHGQSFLTSKCLSGGEHIFTRRNVVLRLRVDSRYKSSAGLDYAAIEQARKDGISFVSHLFPKNMYLVDFMDPAIGTCLKTCYFEEAINIIVKMFKNYKDHQDKFKGKLFDHFEQMWQAQSNETYEDANTSCSFCENILKEMEILNIENYEEIKSDILLNCIHKELETVSKWRMFKEKFIKAFKETTLSFSEHIKKNKFYIVVSTLVALIPIIFYVVKNYFTTNYVSNSCEGDVNRPKKQILRMVAQEYSQQNRDVEIKINRNSSMFSMERLLEPKFRVNFGSCLGLGSDIFAMPRHFWNRVVEVNNLYEDRKIYATLNFNGQHYRMLVKDCIPIELNYHHLVDIIFIQFPKMCCLPRIDKFFVSERDEPVLHNMYLYGRRVHGSDGFNSITCTHGKLTAKEYTQSEMDHLGKFLPARKIAIPLAYEFRTSGVTTGDCGMVLMNTDDKLNSRKILGLHVAGATNGSVGLVAPIYKEDIEKIFEQLGTYIAMADVQLLPIEDSKSKMKDTLVDLHNILGIVPPVNGKKVKLTLPMKTKIQKSMFYDIMGVDFGPSKMAPARLRPFTEDGVTISPFLKGLSKMVRTTVTPDRQSIKIITEHMYVSIINWPSDFIETPRKLTLEEAVNGCFNLNKLDLTTSPGFPYQLFNKSGGKRDWFTIDSSGKMIPNAELMQDLQYRVELAEQGIIAPTFFVDTLKDETRPIEKVKLGKTRIFQVGPMSLSILMRQYFGWFIMHCQSTFVDGEMAIGINPNSIDWSRLLKRMLKVSDKFLNGDFAEFDASVSQPIMMYIVEVINGFYGLPYEHVDNVVRRVLFATFLNSLHIVEDLVLIRLQGNMSGIALTTVVNCLFNMFLIRYAYYVLVSSDLSDYNKMISSTFFGDDNLVAISDAILDKLNMYTFHNVMDSMGLTFTTADKTEMGVPYYTVDNISYLKRKFFKKDDIYYAQLDQETILEIPRWSESDPTNMLDQINRFNCVLYESVNYGFEQYRFFYKRFVEYLKLALQNGFYIDFNDLLSYGSILKSMFPQYFPCELVKVIDQGLNLLWESGSDTVKIRSNLMADGVDPLFIKYTTEQENLKISMSAEGNNVRPQTQINRMHVQADYTLRDLLDDVQFPINFQEEFKFMAQSSEETVAQADQEVHSLEAVDQNTGSSIARNQITTTFDTSIPHIAGDKNLPIIKIGDPYLDASLSAFINREWFLTSLKWGSEDGRNLYPIFIDPGAYMSKNVLQFKLANFSYWSPDIELVCRVNGTAMHYGRMLIAAIPLVYSSPTVIWTDPSYLVHLNCTQARFIQLSPTGNQTVVMKLPFLHYWDRIPLNKDTQPLANWAIYHCITAPLTSANTATPAPVTISFYSRVTNARISGYTAEPSGWLPSENLEAQSEQQTLSNRSNTTAPIKDMGIFPLVNKVGRDVTTLAADMSQVATKIGFGVPVNLSATTPFIVRNTMIGKAEDLPTSVTLGPSLAQTTMTEPHLVNAGKDDMLISKIAGRMALLDTIKITAEDGLKTLYEFNLNPANMIHNDYELKPEPGTCFPLPAAYLSRMFGLWRGSFKFHFAVVSSAFHSMRMRLSVSPPVQLEPARTAPNAAQANFNVNEIWDINNQTDYSFTVPFFHHADWCNISQDIGTLYLTGMTNLTSITDTPNPIYVQVWAAMADDFQLAFPDISAPTQATYLNYIGNPDIGDWVETQAQSDELVAQADQMLLSGNPLMNARPLQFPSLSNEGLEDIEYPVLGGLAHLHKSYRVSTSFEISSVKELCNMLSPVERVVVVNPNAAVSNPTYVNSGRFFTPAGFMDRAANDSSWYAFLLQIMAIFRFHRGGVRMVGFADRAASATAYMQYLQNDWSESFWEEGTRDVFYDSSSLSNITTGCHQFFALSGQPADVVIPYYSDAKCLPTFFKKKPASGANPPPPSGYRPAYTSGNITFRIPVPANTAKGVEICKIVYMIAGADDFQLGYQMPIPRCRYEKPTLGPTM